MIESFHLFRNIDDLPVEELQEYEDCIFKGALFMSPRTAAKAILEILDSFVQVNVRDEEEKNSPRSIMHSVSASYDGQQPFISKNQLK